MSDFERLIRQTLAHDPEAARTLLSEAKRRSDPAAACLAARVLKDREALRELLLGSWKEGRWDVLERSAAALGFALDGSQAQTIDALLHRANGKRQARTLGREGVVDALLMALDEPGGIGLCHGGLANDGTQKTTLCLAYRGDDSLCVGLALAAAKSASPGSAWGRLTPWMSKDLPKNRGRLEAWSKDPGEDQVRLARVDGEQLPLERPSTTTNSKDEEDPQLSLVQTLLETRSGAAWKSLCELADEANTPNTTVQLIAEGVSAWPDGLRVGSPRWFRSATKPKTAHRFDPWVRRFEHHEKLSERDVRLLFGSSLLAQLTELDLTHSILPTIPVGTLLAECPFANNLKWLSLARVWAVPTGVGCHIPLSHDEVVGVLASERLPSLQHLDLRDALNDSSAPQARSFADFALPALRFLDLSSDLLTDRDVCELATAPALRRLETLNLSSNDFGPRGLEALFGEELPQLQSLALDESRKLGQSLIDTLCAAKLPSLRRLSVRDVGLTGVTWRKILDSPLARTVRELRLGNNPLKGDSLSPLVESGWLARLEHLDVAHTGLDDQGLKTLLAHCVALRSLDLSRNPLGKPGLVALSEWPRLGQLEGLNLDGLHLTPKLRGLLTQRRR